MTEEAKELKIESSAFDHQGPIPKKHTAEGENTSPPLSISGAPAGTVSFAIIADDPDAPLGDFVHWLVWNIAASTRSLKEGASIGVFGKNDFGVNQYRGPAPPPGKAHRYFFKVYALDKRLSIPEDSGKQELLNAMEEHVLGKGELVGTFER